MQHAIPVKPACMHDHDGTVNCTCTTPRIRHDTHRRRQGKAREYSGSFGSLPVVAAPNWRELGVGPIADVGAVQGLRQHSLHVQVHTRCLRDGTKVATQPAIGLARLACHKQDESAAGVILGSAMQVNKALTTEEDFALVDDPASCEPQDATNQQGPHYCRGNHCSGRGNLLIGLPYLTSIYKKLLCTVWQSEVSHAVQDKFVWAEACAHQHLQDSPSNVM